ncbi:MAG: hypothetical protein NVS4B11_06180 [Ktedonobacteraceae bacterium]
MEISVGFRDTDPGFDVSVLCDFRTRLLEGGAEQQVLQLLLLTETCDEELPYLITHVETTAATTYDGAVTETIRTALAAKGLLPEEHIVDSGYLDAELIVISQKKYGLALLGPVPADTSWNLRQRQALMQLSFLWTGSNKK